jgi:sugar phosphate isomerase/epimerase
VWCICVSLEGIIYREVGDYTLEGEICLMPLRFGRSVPEFRDTVEHVLIDGIPDLSRFDLVEVARSIIDEGFSVLELAMDVGHIIPNSITTESVNHLAGLKDEFGYSYSVHLPFWSLELASFNEHVRKGSIESTISAIKLVEPLEPETYVLHTTGDLAAEFTGLSFGSKLGHVIPTLLSTFSLSSIEEVLNRTELEPRKLAIENVRFPFTVTRELTDELDLSICFDTAHLLSRMSGTESIMDFYRDHKDKIVEIHLQDGTYHEYDGVIAREDHIPLGQGLMGSNVLREFLLKIGSDKFSGPIIFELSQDNTRESMDFIREIVPEALY